MSVIIKSMVSTIVQFVCVLCIINDIIIWSINTFLSLIDTGIIMQHTCPLFGKHYCFLSDTETCCYICRRLVMPRRCTTTIRVGSANLCRSTTGRMAPFTGLF